MLIYGSITMNCGSGYIHTYIYIYINIFMKPLFIFVHFLGEQNSFKKDKRSYNMKQQKHCSCYKVL